MYDFIMNLNIFVLIAGLISICLLITLSFAVLKAVVFRVVGKDKEPFGQSVMKHFDEITS